MEAQIGVAVVWTKRTDEPRHRHWQDTALRGDESSPSTRRLHGNQSAPPPPAAPRITNIFVHVHPPKEGAREAAWGLDRLLIHAAMPPVSLRHPVLLYHSPYGLWAPADSFSPTEASTRGAWNMLNTRQSSTHLHRMYQKQPDIMDYLDPICIKFGS